jgi:hypothetical protein
MKNFFSACLGLVVLLWLTVNLAHAVPITSTVRIITMPNAPSDLAATSPSPSSAQLTWTDNSTDEDGFSIERKTGVSGTYAEIATTATNIASYTDSAVDAGTTYFYRVRAFAETVYSSYSGVASVTTQTPFTGGGGGGGGGGSSGGGGGGGGSGYYNSGGSTVTSVITNVLISGSAYPSSTVIILKDGQALAQIIAGPDGTFTAAANNLTGGSYVFSVYGEDADHRRSTVYTFPVTITPGVTTVISGIFLSPTIDVDKNTVKKGDTITIFGSALPNANVSIRVDSSNPVTVNATSNAAGAYLYEFDSSVLEIGSHIAKSKATAGNVISNYSVSRAFTVGDENVSTLSRSGCPQKADVDTNCHVDLVDFSILAYWYHRAGFSAKYDLNGDGKIDLVDFSIMAYYWTG